MATTTKAQVTGVTSESDLQECADLYKQIRKAVIESPSFNIQNVYE